jgi:hypothetical protein
MSEAVKAPSPAEVAQRSAAPVAAPRRWIHLAATDDVEDVLDAAGPWSAAGPPPSVVVHLEQQPVSVQRRVFSELLGWPGANYSLPQDAGRVTVRFSSRPQLSVVFSTASVARRVPAQVSVTSWAVDEELIP